jgi:hypothetical protein
LTSQLRPIISLSKRSGGRWADRRPQKGGAEQRRCETSICQSCQNGEAQNGLIIAGSITEMPALRRKMPL